MIIIDSEVDPLHQHPGKQQIIDSPVALSPLDPPPLYEAESPSGTGYRGSLKPVNYVSVVRHLGTLEGSWFIDPSLHVPQALLAPLPSGKDEDERDNLCLEAKAGSIVADVTLVDRGPMLAKPGRKATLVARTHAGNVLMRLHATDSETRPRFSLLCHSRSGSITVYIPRSFTGTMVLSVPLGYISVSKAISATQTIISEVKHSRRCFVGDMSKWSNANDTALDEIRLETKIGHISVLYSDEGFDEEAEPGHASGYHHMGHHAWSMDSTGSHFIRRGSDLIGRVFGSWHSSTDLPSSPS